MSTDKDRSDEENPIDEENTVDASDEPEVSDDMPDFADDDDINQEVPLNRENTLQRIREDYDVPPKGTIREGIQNSGDAWGRNRHEGVLADGAELNITIRVDTERGTFTYVDNAGGMTQETLEDNLLGIDTPDDIKSAGEGAGAYGRGFYVISMCGKRKTYVETRHGDQHHCSTVTNVGQYSKPTTPKNPKLESGIQGTFIHVADVYEHDMEKFQDWDWVEQMLLESFTMLFCREGVSIDYVIDGESHTIDAPDLWQYLEVEGGQLIYKSELPEFRAEGNTYRVHDLYMIRTEAMDEEPPWTGVAMLKGNKYIGPFMTVNAYHAQNIPSLRSPPEMIGWCDASDLCPELENNSHSSFRGHESKTGIKEILLDLHKEHFKKGRTTSERQELASKITDSINELLVEYDDFDSYKVPNDGFEADQGGSEEDDDGTGSAESSGSLIKCQAGNREFDVGDEVPLEVQIANPERAEQERYELFDLEVSSEDVGFTRALPSRIITVPENTHETFDVQMFQPSEEGVYTFSAKVREQPEVMGMEEEDREVLGSSRVNFYVGDVERPRATTKSSDDDPDDGEEDEPDSKDDNSGDEPTQVSVVKNTDFYPKGDDTWKATSEPQEDGGIELIINSNHPEWSKVMRINDDDDRRDRIQHRLGTVWGVEEAVLFLNVDEVYDILGDHTTDGQRTAEIMESKLRKRTKMLSEMEAKIVDQFGIEYES